MKTSMKRLGNCAVLLLAIACRCAAQEAKPLPQADERFKADILLVVAHPDDEGAATAYLARALDEGKHVAVAYGTRGGNGANEAGTEQAAALADIREIEARRALLTLGITNAWFLGGQDTAGQNVLQSLSHWQHGASLEALVRIVRLTRPEIILTFLPGTFIGEDHGDHQAAGVLATEAFDLAGDPATFASQVAGPTKRLEAFLENLRPWQPKKIYYFPDAENEDMTRNLGPEYSLKDVSKLTKHPYWRASLDAYLVHLTQSKSLSDQVKNMDDAQIEKMFAADGWTGPQRFVLGKSLVGGKVTGDIFENIVPGAIPFSRSAISPTPAPTNVSAELAGPWSFYADFRRAHALEHLPHPEPPEIALQGGTSLIVPLWLRNGTPENREVTITVDAPPGWTVQSGAGKFTLAPRQLAAASVEISLPTISGSEKTKPAPQDIAVHVQSNGQSVGSAKLRVELRKRALQESQ